MALMVDSWAHGDIVTRSEDLAMQPEAATTPPAADGIWLEWLVHVVEDSAEQLITYTARGAPLTLPPGPWPTASGLHPWHEREVWSGHGCLMVHRPGDHHAIWHFWDGPDRTFAHWYINLQVAYVRSATGFRSHDLELDIIVAPDGSYTIKDEEFMDQRVLEGRYTPELVQWVREYGKGITDRLDAEGPWWDQSWAEWTPPAGWDVEA